MKRLSVLLPIVLAMGILVSVVPMSMAQKCSSHRSSILTKAVIESSDRVTKLPGYGCVTDIELAGHLPITSQAKASPSSLFYWFVESRTHAPNIPLVLWLNGGPGSSSLYGFFFENGPYVVKDDLTLEPRQISWTEKAHYLVIDQPAGVGFSYGNKGSFANESEAMDQLYEALRHFYDRYPELLSSPLYIAGQSYAGKYIPQLAVRILEKNKVEGAIPLKGILIGDGFVNPLVQQASDADFAYSHGLVDQNIRQKVVELYQQCADEIKKHKPSSFLANTLCIKMQELIKQSSGCSTLVNISKCKELDNHWMITYLNQPSVRAALHVDPRVKPYSTFDQNVGDQLVVGEQDSVAELYPQLLNNNIQVMIYNGLLDGTDSNFMGTNLWLSALPWSKEHQFTEAPTCIWRVNNDIAGFVRSSSGLTQVKIHDAGHIAPLDQPGFMLDLLDRFIYSKPFC